MPTSAVSTAAVSTAAVSSMSTATKQATFIDHFLCPTTKPPGARHKVLTHTVSDYDYYSTN